MFFNLLFTCLAHESSVPLFPLLCEQMWQLQCACMENKSHNFHLVAQIITQIIRWGSRKSHDDANRASVAACVLHVVVEMLLAGGDHIPRVLPEGGAQLAQGRGGHRRRQEAPHVRRAHVQDGGRPGSPSPVSNCFLRK